MADPPPDLDTKHDAGGDTRTPRWVKVLGIIALVVVVLVAVMVFFGGGNHGPGRHTPSGDAGGTALSSSVTTLGTGGDLNLSDRGY